ncbi:hypothetical protein E2C01_076604 [Portunus trituberculatus]|uniref:Uncharacterized protein n=1 Tax=Portunus trituberculatus TaxID=210409 RepID=A0A5B7IDM3_PORTR|nr:hypothetical protein [Portunus trituberculatus]
MADLITSFAVSFHIKLASVITSVFCLMSDYWGLR